MDLEVQPPDIELPPFHQSLPVSTCDGDTTLPDVLEVTNIPSDVDENYLTLYFRSPKSGSAQDAVKECKMIGHGTARILFHRPEGTVHG